MADIPAAAPPAVMLKPLGPCCQEPCRELDDCEVFTESALRGVEVESGRGKLAPGGWIAGEVGCKGIAVWSGGRWP